MPCPYMDRCLDLKVEVADGCVGKAVYPDGTGYAGCRLYREYELERLKMLEEG